MNVKNKISELPDPELGYNPEWDRKFKSSICYHGKLPRISVVTPSYNQGHLIEQTIRSILLQGYPNLEYIIIDAGSTDRTVDIIKKYEKYLTYWTSEPDNGMYDAINKGFAISSGEIMGWSPASDLYVQDAFYNVSEIFSLLPQVQWLTSLYKIRINEFGEEIARYKVKGFSKNLFFKGYHCVGMPGAKYNIQQQSTFWKRSLWERAGSIMDSNYRSAGDFELWARFYQFTDLFAVDQPLGIFRKHADQVSNEENTQHLVEKEKIFIEYGGKKYNSFQLFIRSNRFYKILHNKIGKCFCPGRRTKNIYKDQNSSGWFIKREYI